METEQLALDIRTALKGVRDITEVKMFGGLGFLLNGNLIVAASRRGLLVRVGREKHAEALAHPGVRPMVMRGRTMEGYVFVDPGTLDPGALKDWLRWAMDFVKTLPPKHRKPKALKK